MSEHLCPMCGGTVYDCDGYWECQMCGWKRCSDGTEEYDPERLKEERDE